MSKLEIKSLKASVSNREILHSISLTIDSGEVHAIMGPNGSGKSTLSHVLMGKPGYVDISGSVKIDGDELLNEPTWKRARAGLFLAMQYPVEVPGVSLVRSLSSATGRSNSELVSELANEAERVGLKTDLLERSMNVDLSGGERKRNETVQLAVLKPKFAILDEIDSGLDIDAMRAVASRITAAKSEWNIGVLAITHYARLLRELHPDFVHVMVNGTLVDSGGPELADELEVSGYAKYGVEPEAESASTPFDL
jgi:Fe-S cluster assembly ATP-binding protein